MSIVFVGAERLEEKLAKILPDNSSVYPYILVDFFVDEYDVGIDKVYVNFFNIEFAWLRAAVNKTRIWFDSIPVK